MLDDLRANHLRKGMTTREVFRLIGVPMASVSADLSEVEPSSEEWEYPLGDNDSSSVSLVVYFLDGRLINTAEVFDYQLVLRAQAVSA